MLKPIRIFFPQRILIALRPTEHVTFDTRYTIEVEEGGFVRADIHWDDALSLEMLCYCLMDAYLTRYALYSYGYEAPNQLKSWVVTALAMQTYMSLRPAAYIAWQENQKSQGVPGGPSLVESALEVRERDELLLSRLPFWLHYALKVDQIPQEDLVDLYELAIAGKNVQQRLIDLIQPTEPDADPLPLHVWWTSSLQGILGSRLERYETMEVSRAWLTRLAQFDDFRKAGGELQSIRDLWKLREDPMLRETLEARRELILLHLDEVNPAYFNAAVSLGKLYDRALDAEYAHEYLFALTGYLGDIEDTKRMEQQVNAALDTL